MLFKKSLELYAIIPVNLENLYIHTEKKILIMLRNSMAFFYKKSVVLLLLSGAVTHCMHPHSEELSVTDKKSKASTRKQLITDWKVKKDLQNQVLLNLMQRLYHNESFDLKAHDEELVSGIIKKESHLRSELDKACLSLLALHNALPAKANHLQEGTPETHFLPEKRKSPSFFHKSLDQSVKDFSLDLSAELNRNMLLQNIKVFDILAQVLDQGNVSASYAEGLHKILRHKSATWLEIIAKNSRKGDNEANKASLVEKTEAVEKKEMTSSSIPTILPPDAHRESEQKETKKVENNPQKEAAISIEKASKETIAIPENSNNATALDNSSIKNEGILVRAEKLQGQQEYKGAIKLLEKVTSNDSDYVLSQAKIKEISNAAVQQLRKKAADSFQKSSKTNDRQTKISYLTEAQNYLKEAISQYPVSDQIQTAKENYRVIQIQIASASGRNLSQ